MKNVMIAVGLLVAVPLGGCASLGQINSGSATSDLKKTRIAADDIYVHAVASGVVLVQQGVLSADKYRQLSEQAYQVLLKVRVGESTLGALLSVTTQLGVSK